METKLLSSDETIRLKTRVDRLMEILEVRDKRMDTACREIQEGIEDEIQTCISNLEKLKSHLLQRLNHLVSKVKDDFSQYRVELVGYKSSLDLHMKAMRRHTHENRLEQKDVTLMKDKLALLREDLDVRVLFKLCYHVTELKSCECANDAIFTTKSTSSQNDTRRSSFQEVYTPILYENNKTENADPSRKSIKDAAKEIQHSGKPVEIAVLPVYNKKESEDSESEEDIIVSPVSSGYLHIEGPPTSPANPEDIVNISTQLLTKEQKPIWPDNNGFPKASSIPINIFGRQSRPFSKNRVPSETKVGHATMFVQTKTVLSQSASRLTVSSTLTKAKGCIEGSQIRQTDSKVSSTPRMPNKLKTNQQKLDQYSQKRETKVPQAINSQKSWSQSRSSNGNKSNLSKMFNKGKPRDDFRSGIPLKRVVFLAEDRNWQEYRENKGNHQQRGTKGGARLCTGNFGQGLIQFP